MGVGLGEEILADRGQQRSRHRPLALDALVVEGLLAVARGNRHSTRAHEHAVAQLAVTRIEAADGVARGDIARLQTSHEARLGFERVAAEANIIGAEVGGAMRQQDDAGLRCEGVPLRDEGQDFLDRAIAGADEEIAHPVSRHLAEETFDLSEALQNAYGDGPLARQLVHESEALAAVLAGAGIDD
jgi:hypothetical protein